MLKKVVLPAPFGPIRPLIEPCSITKSMLFTATRPPKRLVTPRASRIDAISYSAPILCLGIQGAARRDIKYINVFVDHIVALGMQLGPAARVGQQALGP